MHKKNFVVAVKVGGKVLRESSDRVELPFGSEYSVMLKNLDTVKIQAQISIDGKQATDWLVIDSGKDVNVERFMQGNLNQGNRFKFIERTERIEQHRGIDAEDGLVRIEFKREKVYQSPQIVHHYNHYSRPWWTYEPIILPRPIFYGTVTCSNSLSQHDSSTTNMTRSAVGGSVSVGALQKLYNGPISCNMMEAAQNEAGITVNGSISNQKFITVSDFECEPSEAIVLHLVGKTGNAPVKIVKTTDIKPVCNTCGKKNKAISKFCSECGTSLEKV